MINRNSRIFITGHKGLVGSAIYRKLKAKGYTNLLIADRKKLDLTNQIKVIKFLKKKKPDFIFIAAAKVGGIYYNLKYKADFITENLQIQTYHLVNHYLLKLAQMPLLLANSLLLFLLLNKRELIKIQDH